jgi:hypothetical protein
MYAVSHMHRGIFAEGLGCVVALVLGGLPVTSYALLSPCREQCSAASFSSSAA